MQAWWSWGAAAGGWLGAALAVYCYFALQVERRLWGRRSVTRGEFERRLSGLVAELEELRAALGAAEARAAAKPSLAGAAGAVNLTRRGQVLRLHGKGRTAAEIAADLRMAREEVELLIKVHDWPEATVL